MHTDNTAVIAATETNAAETKAKAAKKAAPALSAEQAAVASTLDAIKALAKAGVTDGPAMVALQQVLVDAVANAGGTVARGNTLYIVRGEVLAAIDLTPGTLVRV